MTSRFEARLLDRVERQSGYAAIWCIGPRDGVVLKPGANAIARPVKFGVTKDPDELLRKARSWNWNEIDLLAVVWVGSLSAAEAVKEELDDIIAEADVTIRGSWHDMTPEMAEETIRTAAIGVGVEVFDEATPDRSAGRSRAF